MTQPRMVVPGESWMLTRRCKGRRWRLRPSPQTNAIVMYAYAYAAQVTGVLIHALTAMSSHPHVHGTDPQGRGPEFGQIGHRLIARALEKVQGITGPVFCPETRINFVRSVSLRAMVHNMAYVIANPVTSFACKKPAQWRGVWVNPLGLRPGKYRIKRPEGMPKSLPDEVVLEVTLPPALVEAYGEAGARRAIEAEVNELCDEARAEARASGRPIAKAEAALNLDPNDAPSTPPPKSAITPTMAAAGDVEAMRAAKRARRAFYEAYRAAWKLWKECVGKTVEVVFPYGTYAMRVFHGCPVAPPG